MMPGPHPVGVEHDGGADAAARPSAAAAWRSVWPGPTVRTTVLMPSRTCIVTIPFRSLLATIGTTA